MEDGLKRFLGCKGTARIGGRILAYTAAQIFCLLNNQLMYPSCGLRSPPLCAIALS